MKRFSRGGRILPMVILMLFLLASIGCSHRVQVLPESRAVKLGQGDPAPFPGWLLTNGALVKLLEISEKCQ